MYVRGRVSTPCTLLRAAWFLTAARIFSLRTACVVPFVQKAMQKSFERVVHDLMVSVRPCLKPAVEADSYVAV